LAGFASIPLVAWIIRFAGYAWTLPLVTLSAALLGACFPLICHVAIPPDTHAGAGISYLYLANIVGSALGSFVVGFVLMDLWTLRSIVAALALMGILTFAGLLAAGPYRGVAVLGAVLLGVAVVTAASPLFSGIYERLQRKQDYVPGHPFTDVV